jgi:hypothetical protein
MHRIFIALLAVGVGAAVAQAARAESSLDNCYAVRGTSDGWNQNASRERAERHLHRHIAHEMRSPGGHSVGPTHTHCIRNACEATAIVCRH